MTYVGDTELNPNGGTTTMILEEDPICEAVREAENVPGPCEMEVESTTSAGVAMGSVAGTSLASMVSSEGRTMAQAQANGSTIWRKTWSQTKKGRFRIFWSETHNGVFYYDGDQAWITPRRGWEGFHKCEDGYGRGFTVTNIDCWENFTTISGKRVLQQWDKFRVSVLIDFVPIYRTRTIHANAYKNGTMTFKY